MRCTPISPCWTCIGQRCWHPGPRGRLIAVANKDRPPAAARRVIALFTAAAFSSFEAACAFTASPASGVRHGDADRRRRAHRGLAVVLLRSSSRISTLRARARSSRRTRDHGSSISTLHAIHPRRVPAPDPSAHACVVPDVATSCMFTPSKVVLPRTVLPFGHGHLATITPANPARTVPHREGVSLLLGSSYKQRCLRNPRRSWFHAFPDTLGVHAHTAVRNEFK